MSDMWLIQNEGNNLRFTTGGLTGGEGMECYPGNKLIFLGVKDPINHDLPKAGHAIGFGATKGLVNSLQVGDAGSSATAGTQVVDLGDALRMATLGVTGDFTGHVARQEWATSSGVNYWTMLAYWRYSQDDWENTYFWFRNARTIQIKVRKGIIYHWQDNAGTNQTATDDRVKVTSDASRLQVQALGVTGTFTYELISDMHIWDLGEGLSRLYVKTRNFSITVKKGLITAMSVSAETDHGYRMMLDLWPAVNPWEHPPSPS